jgi:hypothetical protein
VAGQAFKCPVASSYTMADLKSYSSTTRVTSSGPSVSHLELPAGTSQPNPSMSHHANHRRIEMLARTSRLHRYIYDQSRSDNDESKLPPHSDDSFTPAPSPSSSPFKHEHHGKVLVDDGANPVVHVDEGYCDADGEYTWTEWPDLAEVEASFLPYRRASDAAMQCSKLVRKTPRVRKNTRVRKRPHERPPRV